MRTLSNTTKDMSTPVSPIIEINELLELYGNEKVIIIDASDGQYNKTNYQSKHLDKALFVDLSTQLANIGGNASKGGRHPLPGNDQFSETLTNLGITEKSHVVIYDDKGGSNAAARFWWMLKSIGHEKVQVLNGGIQEAERTGFPINSETVTINKKEPYIIKDWQLAQAYIHEVEKVSRDKNYIIIDVRSSERYNGITEPIDLVAGHIPDAINVPFTDNLDNNGLFKSSKELRARYEKVFGKVKSSNVIVHCGSGVTACHTILAVAYAGMGIPKLYVGSWSEWSRNNKPIATINKY